MKSADVGGITMRWFEEGLGAPVILLHGIPTSPALWRRVVPLIRDARVYGWEMVGYGDSIPEGLGRDISVKTQARYLRAWMEAVGIPRAVLVGHDLGGGVAQIAAAADPTICAGLILMNSIGYDSWPIPSVKALRRAAPVVERLPNVALKAILAPLLYRGHDDSAIARDSLPIHLTPYLRHDGTRALIRQMRALDTRDTLAVQEALPRLRGTLPARVVWGAADAFQKLRYGQRLSRDLGGQLTTIAGGKHFVPEDHPEVVASAIEEMVAEADFRPRNGAEHPAPGPTA